MCLSVHRGCLLSGAIYLWGGEVCLQGVLPQWSLLGGMGDLPIADLPPRGGGLPPGGLPTGGFASKEGLPQGALPTRRSAYKGVCLQGVDRPPEPEKWAVCILLECFLVLQKFC